MCRELLHSGLEETDGKACNYINGLKTCSVSTAEMKVCVGRLFYFPFSFDEMAAGLNLHISPTCVLCFKARMRSKTTAV